MKQSIVHVLMAITLFGSAWGMESPQPDWLLVQGDGTKTFLEPSEFEQYLESTMSQELTALLDIYRKTPGVAQAHIFNAIQAFAHENNNPAGLYWLGSMTGNPYFYEASANLGYFPAKVLLSEMLAHDEAAAQERYALLGVLARGTGTNLGMLYHQPSVNEFNKLDVAGHAIMDVLKPVQKSMETPPELCKSNDTFELLEGSQPADDTAVTTTPIAASLNDQDSDANGLKVSQHVAGDAHQSAIYWAKYMTMHSDPDSDHYVDGSRYDTKENFIKELDELTALFKTQPIDRKTRIRAMNAVRYVTIKPWRTSDDVQKSLQEFTAQADTQFAATAKEVGSDAYEYYKEKAVMKTANATAQQKVVVPVVMQQHETQSYADIPLAQAVDPSPAPMSHDVAQSMKAEKATALPVIKDTPKVMRDFNTILKDLKGKLEKTDTTTKDILGIVDEINLHIKSGGSLFSKDQALNERLSILLLRKLHAQKLTKVIVRDLMEMIIVYSIAQDHYEGTTMCRMLTAPFYNVLLELYGSSTSLDLTQETLLRIEELSFQDATTIIKEMKQRCYQDEDGAFKAVLLFVKHCPTTVLRSQEFRAYVAGLTNRLTKSDDIDRYQALVNMDKAINLYTKNGKRLNSADGVKTLEEAYRLFPAFFDADENALTILAANYCPKKDSSEALDKAINYFEARQRGWLDPIQIYTRDFVYNNFDSICTKKYIFQTTNILYNLICIRPHMVQHIFSVAGRLDAFKSITDNASNQTAKSFLISYHRLFSRETELKIVDTYTAKLSDKNIPYDQLLLDLDAIINNPSKVLQETVLLDDYRLYRTLLLYAKNNTGKDAFTLEEFKTTLEKIFTEQPFLGAAEDRLTLLFSHLDFVCARSHENQAMQQYFLSLIDIVSSEASQYDDFTVAGYDILTKSLAYRSDADYKLLFEKMIADMKTKIEGTQWKISKKIIPLLREHRQILDTRKKVTSNTVTLMTEKGYDINTIDGLKTKQAALENKIQLIDNAIKNLKPCP